MDNLTALLMIGWLFGIFGLIYTIGLARKKSTNDRPVFVPIKVQKSSRQIFKSKN